MQRQCDLVSSAVDGDPGEDGEEILLREHRNQISIIEEINDLSYQVRCMSQGIKAMMDVTERNMKTIEDRLKVLKSYVVGL